MQSNTEIWKQDTMTPKQNNYYGNHFRADREVRQGDIVSPTIFKIIIDAVIRATKEEMKNEDKTTIIFYADDGFIGGFNHTSVQNTLDSFVRNFKSFGLIMNAKKTKAMTLLGSKTIHRLSEEAYHQKITKEGLSCQQKQQLKVKCEFCTEEIQTKSLKQHQLSKRCQEIKRKTPKTQQEVTYFSPTTPSLSKEPETIVLSVDNHSNTICPYSKCLYETHNRERIRRHFRARHPNDIIIIQQEGLLPQCTNCGLFQKNVKTEQHKNTIECQQ
jgi:hypothetical protein